jgi:predicted dehydrogenase
MDQIDVGLIGFGMAGRVFHGPTIAAVPGLRLAKVVERRSEESRARYPWVEVVRDAAEVFDDERIGLVVVATPNATHFEFARRALLAGKHVVVDKPFTATSEEARELIDLSRERGKLVSAFQNRRWDGDFRTVVAVVEGGLLGRLVEYESHFDRFRSYIRPEAWKETSGPGSGLLFDIGPHLIDQAHVLFGLPEAITADVRIQREGAEVDDQFEVILHYPDPALKVTLRAGVLTREPGPRFALHGTEGSFVKYGLDPQEDALKNGRSPLEAGWGQEPEELWGTLNTRVGDLHVVGKVETLPGSYTSYYENVRDAIAGAAELAVKPEEAANAIRVVELALQSSRERRTVTYS